MAVLGLALKKVNKMNFFPLDFNADTMFPSHPYNPELENIRYYIVECVKGGGRSITTVRGITINAKNTVRIDVTWLQLGMTFRNLTIIYQELTDLKFIVEYEMSGKTIKFEEIDPFGKMPNVMLIGSKNDAQHLTPPRMAPQQFQNFNLWQPASSEPK